MLGAFRQRMLRTRTVLMVKWLPAALRPYLPQWLRSAAPPVGTMRFGDLRRVTPVSRHFGYDRGQPIDRYYIERFLGDHADDVRGRVLEVGDASYTRRFGGDRVAQSDVLHVAEGNSHATIVADITQADHVPSDAFDCIIFTQTLHLVYDARAALHTLHRILKPGGVLLLTVPGISQIDSGAWGEHWYWSFTARALHRMAMEHFAHDSVQVTAHGNVLAAVAFLEGLAVEELRDEELNFRDPAYDVLVTLRAAKSPHI